MCSCIRLNNCISDSTLKYNESAISLHNGREMDRFQERTERRTGKGLYSCVHACPCLFFKMALVEKSGFSADHDDFLTFHTREKSRLAYTDVRLLAVLAWRGISCVCEMARTK